ncbi:cytochrome P450 705A22 [Brassica rapa]|uniref:Cytochrome P450 n=1 Tax=Brassica campestris TaxID=3711 RepID=M4D9H0_BRACM|nr:cytochrome P450 705A22 [Brassica rapa]
MASIITGECQYFILILLCFFAFICFFLFFTKPTHSVRLPPSPPSLPIIGHLHHLLFFLLYKPSLFFFDILPLEFLHTLSSKYGTLLLFRASFFPFLLVSSASVAYEIFTTHDVNVSSRNLPTNEGSIIFDTSGFVTAPYGGYFKFMKKLIVTKLLGPNAQVQSRSIREDELERLRGILLDKARKKESVEINKEARKLVGNIVARMTMGRSFTEENGDVESIQSLVAKANASKIKMALSVLIFGQLEKVGISWFKKRTVIKKFDKLIERCLVEHKEKPNKDQCMDMMDVLLAVSEDPNAEYKITRNNIKAFLVELFLGGIDTSVNSIQWTMAEIINNPIIADRLREEIDSVVGKSRLIQETDLPNLPYLQAVIKEALRLHPPVPIIPREFNQGCTVGGFFVPGKTRLLVNIFAVMRDPNVWEDPLEFKPERFLTSLSSGQEDERNKQTLKYLPFGGGRRGCPASNLGYMIVGTTIGMMLQCFDWSIKGEKVNMDGCFKEFTETMAYPLTFTPVTRISTIDSETLHT